MSRSPLLSPRECPLMDLPAHCPDIACVADGGLNGGLQSCGDVCDGHGRRIGLIDCLGCGVWYMDKAAADIREFLMDIIEDPVHHMVADIGSGGVGQTGRISGVLDGLDHGLHGKIAEVRGIPIRKYRLVNGLVSFVIGDPGIGDVDGYPLRRYAEPAACLADAYDHIRLELLHLFMDPFDGSADYGRDLHGDDLCPGDLISDTFYGLPGRIYGFAAKRIEPCD